MPVLTSAVGSKLGPREFEVTDRRLLAYAAGLGQSQGLLLDDARAGGLVGLPQFCVVPEWLLRTPPEVWGAPQEELVRGVHAAQDSFFHDVFRPGQRLQIEGVITELRETSAGALSVSRLEARDADSGNPIVTSWTTGLLRGVGIEGEPQQLESSPELPDHFVDPAAAESVTIPIAREAPHVYSECAQIWNPIHTERQVALAAGLPDIILHGTATWALAGCQVIARRAGGDPARLKRLHGRFTGMVIPGSEIRVDLAPERDGVVAFEVWNAAGERAISQGIAEIA